MDEYKHSVREHVRECQIQILMSQLQIVYKLQANRNEDIHGSSTFV